jgi:hypothetical protein
MERSRFTFSLATTAIGYTELDTKRNKKIKKLLAQSLLD